MNIDNHNKTNFGWRWPEHKNITTNSLQKMLKNKAYSEEIVNASISPDFDETFFLYQKHFYFPQTNKSYLDITGKRNSRAMYYKHVKKMIKLRDKDREQALEHAGRALHFLQDICQPQHIKEGNIIQKALEKKTHKQFENLSCNNSEILIKNANNSEINIKAKSFKELFENTINKSKQIEVPKRNNKLKWEDIAQEGYNITVKASNKFIEMINHVFN